MSEPLPPLALKAVGLFQNKRFAEAWQALEPVLDTCAGNSDAQQLAGQILKSLNKNSQALAYLIASADLAAERADYRTNLANTLLALGRADEAIGHYETALSLAPAFRAAGLGLGRACLSTGRFQEALVATNRLLAVSPGDAEAWNLKAQAELKSEALNDAATSARRSLEIAPEYVAARHTLANVLLEKADGDGASEALAAIRGSASELPEFISAKARLKLLEGDVTGARDLLLGVIKRHAASLDLQVLLARLRHLSGDPDFTQALREQVKLQRTDSRMRLIQARLLRAAGQFDEALQVLEPALEAAASSPAFLHEAASVYLDKSDFELAARLAESAWRATPATTEMIAQYAQSLLCLGDSATASALIQELRGRQPLDQRFIAFESSCAKISRRCSLPGTLRL